MKDQLPIEFFEPNGHIKENIQKLLHEQFGFDKEGLQQTKYYPGNFKHGAITIFKKIKFDYSFFDKYTLKDWFVLLVHEQVHREDIIYHPQGGLGFYLSYFIGWVKAGFSYRKNEYEEKAYAIEAKARIYWDKNQNKILN